MLTIGNLSLALLWHIYRSLPQQVLADEKIIYKLGKISVTLPALTDGLHKIGNTHSLDPERHTTISNKALPPDRKSSVSSIFSACEQITELSETFKSIGKQIVTAGNFDLLVVPIVDIDICFPEQAISLLFAIRNFICSESIAFVIAAEQETMKNYIISLYNKALSQKQGDKILLSLFDDWVYLPPPQIEKIIQTIDIKLNTTETEQVIATIKKSGVLLIISDFACIHRGFKRFNSFIINLLDHLSVDEYTLLIILFLYGTYRPTLLRKISLHSDLNNFLSSLRHVQTNEDHSLASSDEQINYSHIPVAFRFNHNRIKNVSQTDLTSVNETIELTSLFSNVSSAISNSQIAYWLEKIIPFL
jgi:hypothetical protein